MEEKTKRSLSRKSRVSSLMEEDFANFLTGSISSKDYKNLKSGNEEDKVKYYKNLAKSYKKQLEIATSELEIMKELNENYEMEMDGMMSTQ